MKLNNFILFSLALLLSFFSSCEQDVTTSPPKTLPVNTGILFVDSKPQGAKIFLNGEYTGHSTPDTVRWYEEGNYILTCKMKLFKDTNIVISVKQNETTAVFLDYTKNPSMYGSLYCQTAPPSAAIYLNDSLTNKLTPAYLDHLFPGEYTVIYKKTGYWDSKRKGVVQSQFTTTMPTVFLTDTMTWVIYDKTTSPLEYDLVNHIAIEKGYIKWISTLAGLYTFDDTKWEIFNSENSPLPVNQILHVEIAPDGTKWISTSDGLVSCKDGEWNIYNKSNSGLEDNYIKLTKAGTDGVIWIATNSRGVIRKSADRWFSMSTKNSPLPSDNINCIEIDNNNIPWIGTDYGLVEMKKKGWNIYQRISGLDFPTVPVVPGNNVTAMIVNKFNTLYFAISNYITVYNRLKWISGFYPGVNGFAFDSQNNLWASSNYGVYKFTESVISSTTVKLFDNTNSKLSSKFATSIAVDGANNKWISTWGGGLVKYKGN